MTIFDFAGSTQLTLTATNPATQHSGVALVQLNDELWRVTRPSGDVLGYVEGFLDPRGRRYRSKRLIPLQKRFINIGEFWSFDDAVDCLRFG